MDSMIQTSIQEFSVTVLKNNDPNQLVTNLTPYKITLGEGMSSEHILPSRIYIDQDGDVIYYMFVYYENYASLDSWIYFTEGYEGSSKLSVTNAQATTHTGFQILLSDNIGSIKGPFLLPFTVNLSPVLLQSSVTHKILPNDTFTWDVDMSTYFSDPEGDSLTFTFVNMPAGFTATLLSGTTYRVTSGFPSSPDDINFEIVADDGISAPKALPVIIQIGACASECTKCFGELTSECYQCSGVNFLESST